MVSKAEGAGAHWGAYATTARRRRAFCAIPESAPAITGAAFRASASRASNGGG